MLVLSRKVGQSIAIDNRIVVTILRLGKNKTRFGVNAPDDARIVRCAAQLVVERDADRTPQIQSIENGDITRRGSADGPPPAVA